MRGLGHSRLVKILTLGSAIASLAVAPTETIARTVVIHAGRLIDGLGRTARTEQSIVIIDDRIAAVSDGFVDQPGAEVIDLRDRTVLPGLIDCHVHLSGNRGGNATLEKVTIDPVEDALYASVEARDTLFAGFTSVRNVGSSGGVDVALKHAIDAGAVAGPRIWPALEPLGPTGGHSDSTNGFVSGIVLPGRDNAIVDGVDEAIRQVRDHKKRGATVIKIMPSGGVGSIGDDPAAQLMTDEEIAAITRTAHALGMKVAAHAHGKAAINAAIRNGVDSVEHSTYADAESFRLYRDHGVYLVPTLAVVQEVLRRARAMPEINNPDTLAKIERIAPISLNMFREAVRAKVKIAFGTDATGGAIRHGENAVEFRYLVDGGLTPMEAIVTATANAADLIGSAEVGTIQPGRYADLVAVAGNPLDDITLLERIDFVMKGGVVVRSAQP